MHINSVVLIAEQVTQLFDICDFSLVRQKSSKIDLNVVLDEVLLHFKVSLQLFDRLQLRLDELGGLLELLSLKYCLRGKKFFKFAILIEISDKFFQIRHLFRRFIGLLLYYDLSQVLFR